MDQIKNNPYHTVPYSTLYKGVPYGTVLYGTYISERLIYHKNLTKFSYTNRVVEIFSFLLPHGIRSTLSVQT